MSPRPWTQAVCRLPQQCPLFDVTGVEAASRSAVVPDLLIEERAGRRALRQLQLERDGAHAAGAFAAHQQAFVLAGQGIGRQRDRILRGVSSVNPLSIICQKCIVALSCVRLSFVKSRFCGTLHLLKTCLKASRCAANWAETKVLSIGGAASASLITSGCLCGGREDETWRPGNPIRLSIPRPGWR